MKINLTFLFILLTNLLIAQTYSTIREAFDLQIGDELHYIETNLNSLEEKKSIGLVTEIKTDSLFLQYKINETITYSNGTTYGGVFFIFLYISTLDNEVFEKYVTQPDTFDISMINAEVSNDHFGRRMNSIRYKEICSSSPSCRYYEKEYLEGIGFFRILGSGGTLSPFEKKLVYYKKGNEEWGTPLPPVGTADLPAQFAAAPQLFPNPAKDKSTLTFELNHATQLAVELYDVKGNLVAKPLPLTELALGKQQLNLDLEKLSAGIYFCRLSVGGENYSLKFIKH